MSEVNIILNERGKTYGEFKDNAHISQSIKNIIIPHSGRLEEIHREALDMIACKISRICNGQANHKDSWADIAGYAMLVVRYVEEKGE